MAGLAYGDEMMSQEESPADGARTAAAEGQQLLAQLSVFRGGFSREAAQAVTGVSLPTLARLVSRSLLQFEPGGGRYQVHELLRQFAAEKLASSPYLDAPARHAAYYTAFMQQQAADLKGAAEPDALARIEAEIKNAQSAWQWLAANGRTGQLLLAMDSLGYFYERHGRYLEGQQSYQSISRQWPQRLADDTTGAGHRLLAKALACKVSRSTARRMTVGGLSKRCCNWQEYITGVASVELYALAMRYSVVANSKFYEDAAGHSIRTLAAGMPPTAYQAAWDRGRARDLWETAAEFMAPTGL